AAPELFRAGESDAWRSRVRERSLMSVLTKLPPKLYRADACDGFTAAPDFSGGTGRALAWISQLAYETDDPDLIKKILKLWGLRLVDNGVVTGEVATVLPIANTNGFVAAGRGATIVAFAGTDPLVLANWITDFDIRIRETSAAEGFRRAVSAVWDKLDL